MNKVPFILAMWGFAKNYDGVNIGRLTGMAWQSPYASLYFASTKDWIETYQSAIIKLFTDKWEKWKAKKLKDIIEMPLKTKDWKTRAAELSKFWDENWKTIWNFLNFKDNEVLLKKWTDKDPDWVYQKLFDGMKDVYTNEEYDAKKDKFLETGMYEAHTGAAYTWFVLNQSTSITTTHNLSYTWEYSQPIANVFFNTLEEIKNNNKTTKEEKRKLFQMVFIPFEKKINSAIWALADNKERFNFKTSNWDIPKDFRKYNLLLNTDNINEEEFIHNAFEHFYNNSIKNDTVEGEIEKNKNKYEDIMDYSSSDWEAKDAYDDWAFSNNIDFRANLKNVA